jgi:hypothetical protein
VSTIPPVPRVPILHPYPRTLIENSAITMIFALPIALLGLSSLSVAAPAESSTEGIPAEPSDWVSEPIQDAPISSMKARMYNRSTSREISFADNWLEHVPMMQCNDYHSPVEARTGKHTVWKFCNGTLS